MAFRVGARRWVPCALRDTVLCVSAEHQIAVATTVARCRAVAATVTHFLWRCGAATSKCLICRAAGRIDCGALRQESNDAEIDTNALYSEFEVPTSSDIKLISGTVSSCRPIGQAVQLTLQGVALSIELTVQQQSSIAIGDRVSLAGYRQRSVGTFHALAYRNFHRDVYGWNELPDDSVVTQRQIERERFEKSFRFPIGNVVAWVAKFIAGICLLFAVLSVFSRNGDSPILWLFVGGFFALFGGFAHKVMRELSSGFPQHDWEGERRNHNNWRSMYERARWLVQS